MPTDQNQLSSDGPEPEFVPASTWPADEMTSSQVPYAPPAFVPIQYGLLTAQQHYGPLTVQGNYVSNMDWPQTPTLLPGTSVALEYEALSQPSGSYNALSGDDQSVSDAWIGADEPALHPYDNFYGELCHAQYQDVAFDAATTIYDQTTAAPLPGSTGGYAPHSALAPYQGIWAFNPLNIDDNFVYPTSQTTFPPGEPAPTTMAPNSTDFPAISMASTAPMSMASTAVASTSMATSTLAPVMAPAFMAAPAMVPTSVAPGTMLARYPYAPSDTSRTRIVRQIHPPHSPHVHPSSIPTRPKSVTPPINVTARPAAAPKSTKPRRAKRNSTAQNQLAPRRQGPLSSAQRQKADDMRYYGACWRCRRYKKPCNGPGDCDTCLTSGFRVWPSSVGCYRGNMEDFIIGVMPGNAEQVVNGMNFSYPKVPNWRTHFGWGPETFELPQIHGTQDKWHLLVMKLRATRMAGKGFVELLEVLADYQRSRSNPDTCLELTCSALNHICDIYHAFVATDTDVHLDGPAVLAALTRFRAAYSDNWRQFLQLCLSGRRSAWFPAFLCACINVPLLSVLKDAFVAIPEPARTSLWPNISLLIEDLRLRLYPMGLDLLSALAKGIRPWKLHCWGWKESVGEDGAVGLERDPDGMRLLAGDKGAFDGFGNVQKWLERNERDMYSGLSFLTTPPFSQKNAMIQPVAGLAWIFEVKPPAEEVQAGVVAGLI